jgi:hypothetical protein
MAELLSIKGQGTVVYNLDCPHCEESFYSDHGCEIFNFMDFSDGPDNLNETVQCPECGEKFIVTGFEF